MNEVKKYAETVPESARGAYLKACAGEGSPRSAIKAFCLFCVGYVRQDVTDCKAATCPLHAWRPFQKTSPGTSEGSVFEVQEALDDAESCASASNGPESQEGVLEAG